VVEDTLAGVRAGLAAGAVVACVRDVAEAHLRVTHLAELGEVLSTTRNLLPPHHPETAVSA
jgi:beta-phosphoglucomutase-like phosphatase (HAD superfamily)